VRAARSSWLLAAHQEQNPAVMPPHLARIPARFTRCGARLSLALALALTTAAVSTSTREALALSCLEVPPAGLFASADLVFLGQATAHERAAGPGLGEQKVTLRVDRGFKGKLDREVTVFAGGFKGGFPFEKGKSYLVFVNRTAEGQWRVYDCSGTLEQQYAGPLLLQMARLSGRKGDPVAAPSASPSAGPDAADSGAPVVAPPTGPVDASDGGTVDGAAPPAEPAGPPRAPPRSSGGGCGACAVDPGAAVSARFTAGWLLVALALASRRVQRARGGRAVSR
jgi:hypothetical protein